ncbi:MAG: zinc ribbon domain-containing protein [Desulfatitalea sp.]|nr:zinc ribbon domain-containing protein [Desulfatitalea sp.]NNK01026.1 zinc ribbon domain-containing protein [Desulfatitalea sp.]
MPVYEFECQCGHMFEELVPMNTKSRQCPQCGAQEAKKILSACTFELKGGGWYADGYASTQK